jgi:MFS family permease
LLYTLSNNAAWLIGVQLLDGVGAGIFGAITPLLIADLTRGTGRYNVAQGAVATAQGIGASLSGLAVGAIVDHLGYTAAFFESAVAAAIAFAALVVAMPETASARP